MYQLLHRHTHTVTDYTQHLKYLVYWTERILWNVGSRWVSSRVMCNPKVEGNKLWVFSVGVLNCVLAGSSCCSL